MYACFAFGDGLGDGILLLLLLGECVDIECFAVLVHGATHTIVELLYHRASALALKYLVVVAELVELRLSARHQLINCQSDGGIVDASTTDAVHAIANYIKCRLIACCFSGLYGLFLECGQSCGCGLQLGIHIFALLLGQS